LSHRSPSRSWRTCIVRARYANAWSELYKQRPALVRTYTADVESLRQTLERSGIEVLQPVDLGPIASGRRFEEELIRLMRRYRVDSADAAILSEARRAGIGGIVSEDPDWRRARRDFDVYTWP
jgi:predicted nucleic acid-binding protein